jgi:hypothetical protein
MYMEQRYNRGGFCPADRDGRQQAIHHIYSRHSWLAAVGARSASSKKMAHLSSRLDQVMILGLSLMIAGVVFAEERFPRHISGPRFWQRHVVQKHMPRTMSHALQLALQIQGEGAHGPVTIGADSPYASWICKGLELAVASHASPKEALRFFGVLFDTSRLRLDPATQARVNRSLNDWAQEAIKNSGPSNAVSLPLGKVLLQSPHLSGHLSEKTRGEIATLFSQVGVSLSGRAKDIKITKAPNDIEETLAWIQLDAVLARRWSTQLRTHAQKERERDIATTYRRLVGKGETIDLDAIIADDKTRQAVQAVFHLADEQPPHLFLTYLEGRLSELQARGDQKVAMSLAAAVTALRAHTEQKMLLPRPEIAQMLLSRRLAQGVLAHAGRVSASVALPRILPSLPRAPSAEIADLLARARSQGGRSRQVAYLERQAAILAGSGQVEAQQKGKALRQYLRGYKELWIDSWLQASLHRFEAISSPISWDLTTHFQPASIISPEQVKKVEARLAQAWRILRAVIHPELLKQLPPVTVRLVTRQELGRACGDYDRGTIRIYEGSDLSTILHEFGHHLEENADLRILARMLALRKTRSFGLSDLKRGYGRSLGDFADEYMGRHYIASATEMLSVSLGKFADPQELRQMAMDDGDMVLHVLHLLQNAPSNQWARALDFPITERTVGAEHRQRAR